MEILRSNVNAAWRIFLDRMSDDGQTLRNADPGNIDQGPGDEYEYALCYDPFDFGIGCDCSGGNGIVIGAALYGFAEMSWSRQFSTETFGDWGRPRGFRQVSKEDCLNNYYPIKVWIMHGGGGPYSHMMCEIDGIQMESNGDYGTCTRGHGGTEPDSDIWNDWWVHDGPIVEDTIFREPMSYIQGLDYTSPISGKILKSAGKQFVCRYVGTSPELQWKVIQSPEFQDLMDNDVDVVFNFEGAANQVLNGYGQGLADASEARNHIRTLPGLTEIDPVVYFSIDFDEDESQDGPVFAYFDAVASVLGGVENVGAYGGYFTLKRLMDAGKIKYAWECANDGWSGSDAGIHIDPRFHIIQRVKLGLQTHGGIKCDINEAHFNDFGQCTGGMMATIASLLLDQVAGPEQPDGTRGWPQLAGPDGKPRSLVDATAALVKKEQV